MKHTIKLIICLALIASCKKEPGPGSGKVTFFQMDYNNTFLIVDGENKGTILKSTESPNCGDNKNILVYTLELPLGTHTYWLENSMGTLMTPQKYSMNVRYECEINQIK